MTTPVTPVLTLDRHDLDAVVFDLDGVLTRTAEVHAAAWQALFDHFLAERAEGAGEAFVPFDPDQDYRRYVDGRPRCEGVEAFLAARRIRLPRGRPADRPGSATVCALANRKQQLFLERLRQVGVRTWPDAVDLLERLRAGGFRVAVVTSSANGEWVLEQAGLLKRIDARVDGRDLARFHLRGKPAGDVYLEALRRLETPPGRAAAFEDAASGIQSARAAGYTLVVGVDRGGQAEPLWAAGAQVVLSDLGEVHLGGTQRGEGLPSALEWVNQILGQGRPALFLDFDGTLTGIVRRPGAALLPETVREALAELARRGLLVAVLSGRDLADVRQRVGLPELWYAGSHGFEIAGPQGEHEEHPSGVAALPALAAAEQFLGEQLRGEPGLTVERKRFAIAVHYREAGAGGGRRVEDAVAAALALTSGLRCQGGKKIVELLPDAPWDKGRALLWLLERLQPQAHPIYVGDDLSDEAAFEALRGRGTGIVVQERPRASAAAYRLSGPAEVERLLWRLAAEFGHD